MNLSESLVGCSRVCGSRSSRILEKFSGMVQKVLGHLAGLKDINEIPELCEDTEQELGDCCKRGEGERYLHYLTSVIEQKNTFVISYGSILCSSHYTNLASHKKTFQLS